MIETLPPILGLNFDNIDSKIIGLKERGFSNPKKMIETLPPILGLNFDNIDKKIKIFSRLINLYNISLSPISLMENILPLFSSKMDKLIVLARVLKEYTIQPSEISEKLIRKLIFCNIEDVLVALVETENENETIRDFIKRVDLIKKQKIPKEIKRRRIKEQMSDIDKIKQKYLKGYPEK